MSDSSSGPALTCTEPGANPSPAKTKQPNPIVPEEVVAGILAQQGLPSAKAGVVVQKITTEMTRLHLGPLPAVQEFDGYNKVCPGAARDIVDMAVRQQKHQHWVEKADIVGDMLLPILGLTAAISVIAGMLWIGVYLAVHSHENLSAAVFIGTGVGDCSGSHPAAKKDKAVKGHSSGATQQSE